MFVRILICALLAIVLEFLNGVITFMLPPFLVITPACLLIGLIWASNSRRDAANS
jgi:hypothetical protein